MRKWVLGGCLCVASTSNNPCDEAVAAAKIIDVDAAQKHLAIARQHDLPCVADVGADGVVGDAGGGGGEDAGGGVEGGE